MRASRSADKLPEGSASMEAVDDYLEEEARNLGRAVEKDDTPKDDEDEVTILASI